MSIFANELFAEALRVSGEDAEFIQEGENKAVISIKSRGPKLFSPFLSRGQIYTTSIDKQFIYSLLERLKKKKVPYARLGDTMEGLFVQINEPEIERYTFIINLEQAKEDIWAKIDKKARNSVRKAEKEGVIIEEISSLKDLKEYYELSIETSKRIKEKRKTFSIKPFPFFEVIFSKMVPLKLARFVIAKYQGKIISGGLFLQTKDKILYYHGCSDTEFSNLQAPSAIQWYIIEKGIEEGFKEYDLGGCSIGLNENDSRFFVYEFKRKFGERLRKFFNYEFVLSPMRKKMQDSLIKLVYGGEKCYLNQNIKK